MIERLPEECDCEDEDWDLIEGMAYCYTCGSRRYLTEANIRFERQAQADWDAYCAEMEAEQERRFKEGLKE